MLFTEESNRDGGTDITGILVAPDLCSRPLAPIARAASRAGSSGSEHNNTGSLLMSQ